MEQQQYIELNKFNFKKLYIFSVRQYTSSNFVREEAKVKALKPDKTRFLTTNLQGKASKVLARIYEYNSGNPSRHNSKSWSKFFCKFGHKCYPSESITEHLIGEIETALGFRHAETSLATIGGRIFLLSKNFRHRDSVLVHGAEIYSGYLNDDKEFVEEIGEGKSQKEFFDITDTENAFKDLYEPEEAEAIFKSYLKMLVFDAIVGNNDRHMYNWGVLEDVYKRKPPSFSPIYDSARALLWNHTDKRIEKEQNNPSHPYVNKLRTYAERSTPKVGFHSNSKCNHFELMRYLYDRYPYARSLIQYYLEDYLTVDVLTKTIDKFAPLMAEIRIQAIKDYMQVRLQLLRAC